MQTITAIILTYNEELHIARCIKSLQGVADKVYVIDSYSTDKTLAIASELGAVTLCNTFVNQAVQFNWALENCPIDTDWILRIDADEYIDAKKGQDVRAYLSELAADVSGIIVSRKIVFMGRALLHGGWYPKWNLRIFRTGHGVCENRWMDEHIILTQGKALHWQLDFVDDNLHDLSWWISKHNNYATREAMDYFMTLYGMHDNADEVTARFWGNDAERKRWLKQKYLNFPLFVRPFINFIYRYIFRLGFLDGKQGLVWHVLQGFWYRFLVDAKIWEIKRYLSLNPSPKGEGLEERERIVAWLREKYLN